jgi:hypothetical protein
MFLAQCGNTYFTVHFSFSSSSSTVRFGWCTLLALQNNVATGSLAVFSYGGPEGIEMIWRIQSFTTGIECHGAVDVIPVLYSEGPGFKALCQYRLF